MNITVYIESKRNTNKRIPAEIRERWNNRILQRSLHLMGTAGAIQYLADYGRGIALPKVVNLAICAESEGYPDMALGFWNKAFELETGEKTTSPITSTHSDATTTKTQKTLTLVKDLPPHLQPGHIVTMQPVDASSRTYYINSPDYWGQPKRDGNRLIVIATKKQIYYQSRSTRIKEQPSIEINQALLEAATQLGSFVLDGELYYRSVTLSEHRTGSQAATVNIAAGAANIPPTPVYAIFKSLWFSGKDLTTVTEAERIAAGEEIGKCLQADFFEVVPTARTSQEKAELASKQQLEAREGEIWLLKNCTYIGGKDTRTLAIVRTKYCVELDLVITGLTSKNDPSRPFSAIMVAQEKEGKLVPMGLVGTGFTQQDMLEIVRRHGANPGGVKITVRTQGLTESGKLWHGRYVGFCEENEP
ncbi:ATP-dependent DNA ligase [Cylindrospermum sp. FACHB-282]|uniref:ATP-dependent DNA ligase n=1 Tax=Cylindrospermum sp. FACHB-282 TaxID=2692794 RepID=UPI001684C74B|nr:ATP-dependent DNA ligase [Cylindrospermum sp. FACHB-282]MBD2385808.1 ATP-dependent DNA ligase [Cylindrospermum sp. FACHB-282]